MKDMTVMVVIENGDKLCTAYKSQLGNLVDEKEGFRMSYED